MNFYVEVIQRQANDLAETIGRLQDTFLTDQTQPLEERWEAYQVVADYLPIDPYITTDCIRGALGEYVSLYDDFRIQRYQTVKYTEFVENLEEDLQYALEYRGPEEDVMPYYKREDIDKLRELVLASGKQGFVMDW